jgi:hypothetical protein
MVKIEVMKTEVITYQTLADCIKSWWNERMTRGRTLLTYRKFLSNIVLPVGVHLPS